MGPVMKYVNNPPEIVDLKGSSGYHAHSSGVW